MTLDGGLIIVASSARLNREEMRVFPKRKASLALIMLTGAAAAQDETQAIIQPHLRSSAPPTRPGALHARRSDHAGRTKCFGTLSLQQPLLIPVIVWQLA